MLLLYVTLFAILLLFLWNRGLALYMRKNNFHCSLRGKSVIITGATDGYGRYLLLELFKCQPDLLIFTGRDQSKVQPIITELVLLAADCLNKSPVGEKRDLWRAVLDNFADTTFEASGVVWNRNVVFYPVEMSDLQQVEKFALFVASRLQKIHVLINNAGGIYPERARSQQGFERSMAANYLGMHHLTNILSPIIAKTEEARIINVSSCVHKYSLYSLRPVTIDFEDLFAEKEPYNHWVQYSRSKLAVNLFTKGLGNWAATHALQLKAVSVHPGICLTSLNRGLRPWELAITRLLWLPGQVVGNTREQACQTVIGLVQQPWEQIVQGGYYFNCAIDKENPFVSSRDNVQRLWEATREIVGKCQGKHAVLFPSF
jgi:NAD(P)-dependent dehydrogenase (short-subunit alcohol dehydrogenase family)